MSPVALRAVPAGPDYRTVLGKAIRERPNEAGWSQEMLSELTEPHPNYLGRVERAEETISLPALLRGSKALRLRLRDQVADL